LLIEGTSSIDNQDPAISEVVVNQHSAFNNQHVL